MKFHAACAFAVTLLVPAASALSIFEGQNQATISDQDHRIPGESPLELCDGDHEDDLIIIKSVDLLPNPPKAGQELIITASGTVKEKIQNGAYIKLVVKYGLIRLLTTTADLCEQIGNVDLSCPLEAGDMDIVKTVQLPKEIPPGTYNVSADVYTADDVPITCLTAKVSFSIPGTGFFQNEL